MKKFILPTLLLLTACVSHAPGQQIQVLDAERGIYKVTFRPDYKLADTGLSDFLRQHDLCPNGYKIINSKTEKYKEARIIPGDQQYQESEVICK